MLSRCRGFEGGGITDSAPLPIKVAGDNHDRQEPRSLRGRSDRSCVSRSSSRAELSREADQADPPFPAGRRLHRRGAEKILITAVRNGELDDQLAPAKKPVTAMTTRKAA